MKWLIDNDNQTKTELSTTEFLLAKELINTGMVRDGHGDIKSTMDVTDCDGDLIIDEKMYDGILDALEKKPHKL